MGKAPDILLFAGEPHEDPLVIQAAADMAISNDFVSRGYTIIWAAKELGAKTFVHISFPRHMSYETLGLRRQIMEATCNDVGVKFVFETAPDPTSDVGVAGAQQFILEKVPQWIEKYGKETAFFYYKRCAYGTAFKTTVTVWGHLCRSRPSFTVNGISGRTRYRPYRTGG